MLCTVRTGVVCTGGWPARWTGYALPVAAALIQLPQAWSTIVTIKGGEEKSGAVVGATQSEGKIVKNTHIHMHNRKNRGSNNLPAAQRLGLLELLLGSAPAPLWVALVARMDGGLQAPTWSALCAWVPDVPAGGPHAGLVSICRPPQH